MAGKKKGQKLGHQPWGSAEKTHPEKDWVCLSSNGYMNGETVAAFSNTPTANNPTPLYIFGLGREQVSLRLTNIFGENIMLYSFELPL
jgi:hypothetical protein